MKHTQTASESKLIVWYRCWRSTELVAGAGFTPLIMRDLPMGCVELHSTPADGELTTLLRCLYRSYSSIDAIDWEEYTKAPWESPLAHRDG